MRRQRDVHGGESVPGSGPTLHLAIRRTHVRLFGRHKTLGIVFACGAHPRHGSPEPSTQVVRSGSGEGCVWRGTVVRGEGQGCFTGRPSPTDTHWPQGRLTNTQTVLLPAVGHLAHGAHTV